MRCIFLRAASRSLQERPDRISPPSRLGVHDRRSLRDCRDREECAIGTRAEKLFVHDLGSWRNRAEDGREGIFVNEAAACGIQPRRITSNSLGVCREQDVGDAGIVSHVVEHGDQSASLVVPILNPDVSTIDWQHEVPEGGVVVAVGYLPLGRRAGRQEKKWNRDREPQCLQITPSSASVLISCDDIPRSSPYTYALSSP